MTKPLTPEEKKKKKEARKQQKKKSTTVRTIEQPATDQGDKPPVNLCDDCAYEYGECEGIPKFAEAEGADNIVIECPAYIDVQKMPTADQAVKGAGAVTEATPFDLALEKLDDFGKYILKGRESEIINEAQGRFDPDAELSVQEMADTLVLVVQEIIEKEGGPSDGTLESRKTEPVPDDADTEARRARTQRFARDEDFGTCQACNAPLKRTALNREIDAIRCTNSRCTLYRHIIRTISAGA